MAKLLTALQLGRKNIIGSRVAPQTTILHTAPPVDGTSDAANSSTPRRQHSSHGGSQSQCRLEERPEAAAAVVVLVGVVVVASVEVRRHNHETCRDSGADGA